MTKKVEKSVDSPEEGEAFDEAIEALKKMKQAEVVDEELLGELNVALVKLSDDGQRKFMDLPIMQMIAERASEDAVGTREPGATVRVGGNKGLSFSFKVPYSLNDVYEKWPPVKSFIPDNDQTVVVPGGWVFKLHEGIIYDTPRGAESCPEDHGYQLPCIVIDILAQAKATLRQNKRDTEKNPFGLGVRFLETGWAGKEAVKDSDPSGHDADRDQ